MPLSPLDKEQVLLNERMGKLQAESIEILRKDFAPKTDIGTKLPTARDTADNALYILKESGTKKLYIMSEGKWNLIGTLTEV